MRPQTKFMSGVGTCTNATRGSMAFELSEDEGVEDVVEGDMIEDSLSLLLRCTNTPSVMEIEQWRQ